MKFKLIVFDIDGTITDHISSWRYMHERLGLWDALAHKYQEQFMAGKISYRRFCELDAAHWKGISERKIKMIFKEVPYIKNVKRYVNKLKKSGFRIAAVSTGLQYIAERIKKELEFDYVLSNRLISRDGILTGGVKINITHGEKGKIFGRIVKRFNVKQSEAISIGDSAGDIPLMKKSGYSIAFNSSSKVLSRAADYNCKTKDFKEVFDKIIEVSGM